MHIIGTQKLAYLWAHHPLGWDNMTPNGLSLGWFTMFFPPHSETPDHDLGWWAVMGKTTPRKYSYVKGWAWWTSINLPYFDVKIRVPQVPMWNDPWTWFKNPTVNQIPESWCAFRSWHQEIRLSHPQRWATIISLGTSPLVCELHVYPIIFPIFIPCTYI